MDSRERIRSKDNLISPRQVLRRLMLLTEGRQYREAGQLVTRLGPSVLRSVLGEIPMDLLVENLPHSTYLLEAFFMRLNATEKSIPRPSVQSEAIVWHLVKLFSNPHESGLKQRSSNLIQSIALWNPEIRDMLRNRKKELDKAVQGLGIHGLAADQTGALISLHIALKTELQRHIDTYKMALHKIDESNPVTKQNPAQSSHQRLLAYNHSDIQQRLIDNKTLLTILDKPVLKQLSHLKENLSNRVQNDKEVLFCVGQIRRIDPASNIEERPAAGLLMDFSKGCHTVLEIASSINKPISPSTSGDSDGYHSDSYSNLDDYNSELVKQYHQLYTKNRIETLEVLNSIPQLKQANHLKIKILFSIVVLAFRTCFGLRERKVLEVRRLLHGLEKNDEPIQCLDRAVRQYLKDTSDSFPMGDVERQVANQVLSTLHEYPCLDTCTPLIHYISECVRHAWKMSNQLIPYYLDMDFTLGLMRIEKHERFISSDDRSDIIRGYLWPALIQNNKCVCKAIVVT